MKRWIFLGALLLLSLMLSASCTQRGNCAVSSKTLYYEGVLYYFGNEDSSLYAFDGESTRKVGDFYIGHLAGYEGDLICLGAEGMFRIDPKTGQGQLLMEHTVRSFFVIQNHRLYSLNGEYHFKTGERKENENLDWMRFASFWKFYSDEKAIYGVSQSGKMYRVRKDGGVEQIGDFSKECAYPSSFPGKLENAFLVFSEQGLFSIQNGEAKPLDFGLSLGSGYLLEDTLYAFGGAALVEESCCYQDLFRVDPKTGEGELLYPNMLACGDAVYDLPGVFAGPYYFISTIHKPLLSIDRDLSDTPSAKETAGAFSVTPATSLSGQVDVTRYALILDLRTGEIVLLGQWEERL